MRQITFLTIVIAGFTPLLFAGEKTADGKDEAIYVAVFDFQTLGGKKGDAQVLKGKSYGHQLADSVRLKFRKQGARWKVIDRLTTADVSETVGLETDAAKVAKLLSDELGAHIGLFGTVQNLEGGVVRAEIACIDLRRGARPVWSKVFSDDSERARAIIAAGIVQAVVGGELWKPPEYGDEPEPTKKQLGKPLNINGDFEAGSTGWDAPDNVSTFIEAGQAGHGKVLRVQTDLKRDPWLAYRKALRKGQADPSRPPKIARDTSYGCVGGLEGVHYRSEWIKATPGQRYWLLADVYSSNASPGSIFFPKVFVKGFKKTRFALDGLPESALARIGLTPRQFADLPPAKRKALIEADAKKNPKLYLRECYRWYLACRCNPKEWTHRAAAFPPRGGLPKDVEFLQIQIYSYWPPGTYMWDNVQLYKDPRQKAPLPEQKARTPHFGKTSDVVEKDGGDKK
jgi:hypothetical protein